MSEVQLMDVESESREVQSKIEPTIYFIADWDDTRCVVELDRDCNPASDAEKNHFEAGMRLWLSGEKKTMILPPGAKLTLYMLKAK